MSEFHPTPQQLQSPDQRPPTPTEAVRNFNGGCRTVIKDVGKAVGLSSFTLYGLEQIYASNASGNRIETIVWTVATIGNALGVALSTIDAGRHLYQTVRGKQVKENILPGGSSQQSR